MKKLILALGLCGLMFTTSCKKEVSTEQDTEINADGSVSTETKTDVDYEMNGSDAEAAYNKAQADLAAAKEKGDTEAERLAQETSDNAKAAWDKSKAAGKEVGQDVKEGYNEALEDAKAD